MHVAVEKTYSLERAQNRTYTYEIVNIIWLALWYSHLKTTMSIYIYIYIYI